MGGVEVDDDVLIARAYLSRVVEAANVPVWAHVVDVGPVQAMHDIATGSAPKEVVRATAARAGDVDPIADLETAEHLGIRLVVPESDLWPHFAFAALEHAGTERWRRWRTGESRRGSDSGEPVPPLALWVRGAATADLPMLGLRSVGMVGSRAATQYGEHVTTELAYRLARRDVAVISGGAYGIDAAAHRGALAATGLTALVTAGGLDRPYPPGNANLFERVVDAGLVLSESPPGSTPQRQRFLSRNRLIAALSTGVVVTEAARRSGATNTAGHCKRLGRPLMAVPGPVTSAMSAGCHDLLRDEEYPALLVTSVEEVLAVVGGPGEGLPDGARPEAGDLRDRLDGLAPTVRRVFEGLTTRRYSRPDEIAKRAGVPPLDVLRSLPSLELAGLAEASDGGYRVAEAKSKRAR
jgi:DNA processing protein